MTVKSCSVEEATSALADGQVVIVLDSMDRENEGDFVAAAEKITPQMIHFMLAEGLGQLCVPVGQDVASRLCLEAMVPQADEGCAKFVVPVDHENCKTGISPLERCMTIQAMLDDTSQPDDFLRPGHVFPLIAEPGGVLQRPGHTEAAVDLARLAGLKPAGVLCEICSRDGLHMADFDELLQKASDFGLSILTIDELIDFLKRGGGGDLYKASMPPEQLTEIG